MSESSNEFVVMLELPVSIKDREWYVHVPISRHKTKFVARVVRRVLYWLYAGISKSPARFTLVTNHCECGLCMNDLLTTKIVPNREEIVREFFGRNLGKTE